MGTAQGAITSEPDPAVAERVSLGGRSLRQQAARGTLVNSAFQAGLAGLGLLQRLVVAAFLSRTEFGVWGVLVVTLLTLMWLKELGVGDKYVQQNEADQELAFQKAFTLETLCSLAFFALAVALLPLYAIAYGTWQILVPGIVLALSVPLTALESPQWIAYRRMDFVRQRTLAAVDTVTVFVVSVALAVAGLGYWALVIGTVTGSLVGGVVAIATCPYRIAWRFDRRTLREYASFSWPLFGYGFTNLVAVQGSVLVGNRVVGLAGVGAIGLATSISSFADRIDGIVSQTIYPAVCAVAEKRDKLFEAFVKSNRLALIWGVPFGVGLALFARDLVHFGLGTRWEPAIPLLAAFGLIAAFHQIGFNYSIFFRAVNNTRPMFVTSVVTFAGFLLVAVPLIVAFGLTGYAIGFGVMTAIQLAVRGWYLSRLFSGFHMRGHLLRAIAPSIPAAAAVLLVRAAVPLPDRLWVSLLELVLYAGVTVAATLWFERALMREVLGYLRGRPAQPLTPGVAR
ncbi:MAG: oligosaccharide flippase family protein [Thermoleophilaceae bacterium]